MRAKPGKLPKRKPFSLNEVQSIFLLHCLAREPIKFRLLTIIAIFTGLRRGELLGLTWKNTDMANMLFKVEMACQHIPGKVFIRDELKTASSTRTVPFPQELLPLLEEYRLYQHDQSKKLGGKWHDLIEINGVEINNTLIFTQWNGQPMHPNSVDTWFKKFKVKNQLPEQLKFHGLRHTNITLLLNSGVDIGAVSDNAGHSKKSTTLDIYYASIPRRVVADKMGSLLGNQLPSLLKQPANPRRSKKPNK